MRVCVVGLGKVGLPLAAQYASRDLEVAGYDLDQAKVDAINAGRCPIVGEADLGERLADALAAGRLRATTDPAEALAKSEAVVVIVPVGLTPDRQPDLTSLDAATEALCAHIAPGALVLLESTVPVGSTRRLGHALEEAGRRLGGDCFVAYSPERVSSGHIFRDLRRYPKLVGASDQASWERAKAFYDAALEAPGVIRLRDPETAEFSKLAEGIYRDLNIALASELARYADSLGLDALDAFVAANTQPYSHLHQPGVGVGGHCLPVYPYFIPPGAGLRLAREAREVNDGMAAYAINKLADALGSLDGTVVLILGLSYRPNVKEAAHSSAVLLAKTLEQRGARPLVHDPFFSDDEIRSLGLQPPPSFPPERVDALIVQALHDAYREIDLRSFPGCRAVLDGRNALDRARVEAAGLRYLGIGR